jgi:hypothetical protein
MDPEARWDTWASWLGEPDQEGTICDQLVRMLASRQLWDGFQAIVGSSPAEARRPGLFHSWVNTNYVHTQVIAIRRLTDERKGVRSLTRLLDDISRHHEVITRERFLSRLHPHDLAEGNEAFDVLAGDGTHVLSPELPRHDLKSIKEQTADVRRLANERIAHFAASTERFTTPVSYGDLHRAMDLIFKVFNRYYRLIRGVSLAPVVALGAWESAFRVAWIPDDETHERVAAAIQEAERRRAAEMSPDVVLH